MTGRLTESPPLKSWAYSAGVIVVEARGGGGGGGGGGGTTSSLTALQSISAKSAASPPRYSCTP